MEDKDVKIIRSGMGLISIDMIATGQRIRTLMQAKDLNVKQLAEQMEVVSPQAIYKWLRGDTIPSWENLFLLKDILGVDSVEDLFVFRPHVGSDTKLGSK